MTKEYNIRKATGQCSACRKCLEPGTELTATVTEDGQELLRQDFCDECWSQASGGEDKDVLCVWRTRVPQPAEKKKLFIDDELLVNLFERLGGDDRDSRINFRYVLALALMRKKLLVYDRMDTDDAGRDIWTMHLKRQEAKHRVIDPKLTVDQIAEVIANLGEIMEGEF